MTSDYTAESTCTPHLSHHWQILVKRYMNHSCHFYRIECLCSRGTLMHGFCSRLVDKSHSLWDAPTVLLERKGRGHFYTPLESNLSYENDVSARVTLHCCVTAARLVQLNLWLSELNVDQHRLPIEYARWTKVTPHPLPPTHTKHAQSTNVTPLHSLQSLIPSIADVAKAASKRLV